MGAFSPRQFFTIQGSEITSEISFEPKPYYNISVIICVLYSATENVHHDVACKKSTLIVVLNTFPVVLEMLHRSTLLS